MISLSRSAVSALLVPATMCLLIAIAQAADNVSEPKVKVDDNSFKCITDMTPVRHFYVDNLLGNVEATAAVAKVLPRSSVFAFSHSLDPKRMYDPRQR